MARADLAAFDAKRAACLRSNQTGFTVMELEKALAELKTKLKAARKTHGAAHRAYKRAEAKWRATPSGQLETAAVEQWRKDYAARTAAKPSAA